MWNQPCAECYFIDLIADVAILGEPSDWEVCDPEAYRDLVSLGSAFEVADLPGPQKDLVRGALRNQRYDELETLCDMSVPGFLFSLKGEWYPCDVKWYDRLWVSQHKNVRFSERTERGMSGSPCVDAEGRAVATVSTGDINPRLMMAPPGWFLKELEAAESRT
jgi:hypothetical protein